MTVRKVSETEDRMIPDNYEVIGGEQLTVSSSEVQLASIPATVSYALCTVGGEDNILACFWDSCVAASAGKLLLANTEFQITTANDIHQATFVRNASTDVTLYVQYLKGK
jgi:hypothetical protein